MRRPGTVQTRGSSVDRRTAEPKLEQEPRGIATFSFRRHSMIIIVERQDDAGRGESGGYKVSGTVTVDKSELDLSESDKLR